MFEEGKNEGTKEEKEGSRERGRIEGNGNSVCYELQEFKV
jgi:hypothetical protein